MLEKTKKNYGYEAFGLRIVSEFPLPELHKMTVYELSNIDLHITLSDLTAVWNENASPDDYFFVKETECLFHVPDVAIYSIQQGERITISPMPGVSEDHIRIYVLGTCMGILLMQRKVLPLHGSAIAINGNAYAIVGDSGAGKSTLAAAFLSKGYKLLTDDVIALSLSAEKAPIVTPAYPQQKLWIQSLDQFGMDADAYRPIVERETKFAIPVSAQFERKALPLKGIFELVKTETNRVTLKPITKLERFHKLFYHTYRGFMVPQLQLMDWHFAFSANIIKACDLYQLERPNSSTVFTAHELVETIIETIEMGDYCESN
ncbi:aldolase [Alkalihalobacillus sp. LMS39]|uniref:aldolase n=1 Tax=Alkalihalobacillus sp. LMS39 TaxID=2924032 RepID=UPI001FB3F42F|nr:aldolase [Alkalihalobacillus sp. LMS39]UOE95448.1 aldolase [Alkalihalobacillus sp. LMS39]